MKKRVVSQSKISRVGLFRVGIPGWSVFKGSDIFHEKFKGSKFFLENYMGLENFCYSKNMGTCNMLQA